MDSYHRYGVFSRWNAEMEKRHTEVQASWALVFIVGVINITIWILSHSIVPLLLLIPFVAFLTVMEWRMRTWKASRPY